MQEYIFILLHTKKVYTFPLLAKYLLLVHNKSMQNWIHMMTGGCEVPPSHQPRVKWLSSELGSWTLEDLVPRV